MNIIFEPPIGSYDGNIFITIVTDLDHIYYNFDNSQNYIEYTTPIFLNRSKTIYIYSHISNVYALAATAEYTINTIGKILYQDSAFIVTIQDPLWSKK